jgi:hypothetical protein
MYYDESQGRFVVDEMAMGVNESVDSATTPEASLSNTSDSQAA